MESCQREPHSSPLARSFAGSYAPRRSPTFGRERDGAGCLYASNWRRRLSTDCAARRSANKHRPRERPDHRGVENGAVRAYLRGGFSRAARRRPRTRLSSNELCLLPVPPVTASLRHAFLFLPLRLARLIPLASRRVDATLPSRSPFSATLDSNGEPQTTRGPIHNRSLRVPACVAAFSPPFFLRPIVPVVMTDREVYAKTRLAQRQKET